MRTAHSQIWRDEDVKAIHYLFEKPWNENENGNDNRKTRGWWWEMDEERRLIEKEKGLFEPDWS